ncbi:putative ABC transport protein [Haemophilus influenzae HK1212]|uniref:Putative ABC transport protein n=1 Tax=Haemophilus influenzae HK1212 TaxID=456482 RepID=A0A7G2JXR7_HAEIF|nr:putative ABC transport protein [Haemophilus influenzae HK1212]
MPPSETAAQACLTASLPYSRTFAQTQVPYLLLDGRLSETPALLRKLLGVRK